MQICETFKNSNFTTIIIRADELLQSQRWKNSQNCLMLTNSDYSLLGQVNDYWLHFGTAIQDLTISFTLSSHQSPLMQ